MLCAPRLQDLAYRGGGARGFPGDSLPIGLCSNAGSHRGCLASRLLRVARSPRGTPPGGVARWGSCLGPALSSSVNWNALHQHRLDTSAASSQPEEVGSGMCYGGTALVRWSVTEIKQNHRGGVKKCKGFV